MVTERNPGKALGVPWRFAPEASIASTQNPLRADERTFYFQYFRHALESEWIGQMHLFPDHYLPDHLKLAVTPKPQNEERSRLIKRLIKRDLDRVNLWVACVAWLTYDGWRWKDDTIPEDLCYGLLNEHPEFVVPYSVYASGLMKQRLRALLIEGNEVERYLEEAAWADAEATVNPPPA
ncbi:MAG: hypothetical protein ABEK59_12010 [Halobacteria archaeon]